ncbi:Cystathionine beta-lyases/cystathionine gamma-synthases [Phaffia rhodozyma]|uniref:cystathionine gamma-synthase n=1 Tax=Phaffia rhodozyma TaxID=264483 RepID=A0A0F7SSX0_PHARH|nr:Cystathionine beta-lyases/cystathionine gamma-synthases [Phaffia rhodozyma]
MSYITAQKSQIPVGCPIPRDLPHAVSVSLPTWEDNVAYEEGEPWIKEAMQTGYPRFFIHKSIQKLASICLKKFGQPNELCLLLPHPSIAQQCRSFLCQHSPEPIATRIVDFVICAQDQSRGSNPADLTSATSEDSSCIELQIILFPEAIFPLAKSFWQHTGEGISSRRAERCLISLGENTAPVSEVKLVNGGSGDQLKMTLPVPAALNSTQQAPVRPISYSRNRHYSRGGASTPTLPTTGVSSSSSLVTAHEDLTADHSVYVEQRYGRNLPLASAALAKQALRRRIAGGFKGEEVEGRKVSEDDVWLFSTGMSAIYNAHLTSMRTRPGDEKKSVCFGFPYTDTLKVLQKFGPGSHFFGKGSSEDIESLATLLAESRTPENPRPIQALFCEFPGNPLLRSPDLRAIRKLADEYGFYIVVDETIGNFVNVEVLEWADIVVSSLTKIFSGDVNVMGGSLVLNSQSKHYTDLRAVLDANYEDTYLGEDAIFMERNSRDFRSRIHLINANTEILCDLLRSRSLVDPSHPPSSVIKDVYYPKWSSATEYSQCRRPILPTDVDQTGRFGGLFSVTLTSDVAAKAFFNSLPCAKGPSLGTNFTLASPYVILAHYLELDWAESFGVERNLIRISVGMEETEVLKQWFEFALNEAEKAEKLQQANKVE